MKDLRLIIIITALLIVVGAGSFYAGGQYQQSQKGQGGQSSQIRQRLGQNFRPVTGEIISFDDKSITVKIQDGSSKIVLVSEATSITEATSAGKQALQVGKEVFVSGNQNSDGSVTAQNIQLNPTSGGMFGQRSR